MIGGGYIGVELAGEEVGEEAALTGESLYRRISKMLREQDEDLDIDLEDEEAPMEPGETDIDAATVAIEDLGAALGIAEQDQVLGEHPQRLHLARSHVGAVADDEPASGNGEGEALAHRGPPGDAGGRGVRVAKVEHVSL